MIRRTTLALAACLLAPIQGMATITSNCAGFNPGDTVVWCTLAELDDPTTFVFIGEARFWDWIADTDPDKGALNGVGGGLMSVRFSRSDDGSNIFVDFFGTDGFRAVQDSGKYGFSYRFTPKAGEEAISAFAIENLNAAFGLSDDGQPRPGDAYVDVVAFDPDVGQSGFDPFVSAANGGGPSGTDGLTFDPAIPSMHVENKIYMWGSPGDATSDPPGGSATLVSFRNRFNLVPEPTTPALLLAGLAAAWATRRKPAR